MVVGYYDCGHVYDNFGIVLTERKTPEKRKRKNEITRFPMNAASDCNHRLVSNAPRTSSL